MTEVFERFDIGKRVGRGPGSKIAWRPIGSYENAQVEYAYGLAPGGFSFQLPRDHPVNDVIASTGIQRTAYHFRAQYNGLWYWGRIQNRKRPQAAPNRDTWTYSGFDGRYHLMRLYCWVNNLFPPEVQFNITGKQNVKWGTPDYVFKSYVSEVATRMHRPIYSSMPVHWPTGFTYTNLDDISTLDHLVQMVENIAEAMIIKQARFTQLDELFKDDVTRLQMGISMDLWDHNADISTAPKVFNTASLSNLQSIIDYTSDNFLDLSKLASLGSLWKDKPDRASWIFDTQTPRDRRQVQFRTDAEYGIQSYEFEEIHSDAVHALVGGKSPSIVNNLIQIGANLAIQLLLNLVFPGLGLGVIVGNLFDDIFFAYQVYWDNDLENDIGPDDAFGEIFADNTAAWSLDSYAVGHTALHEHAGSNALTIAAGSGIPGKGNSFGADDGTARRYRHGDYVRCWDRGNTVDQLVSKVVVHHQRGQNEALEVPTLGDDTRLTGTWDRALAGINRGAATMRGFANST